MKMSRKLFLGASLALAAAMVQAQAAWPVKPLKLVVPLPPGGGGDITARIVAHELGNRLKQTVVVENRPGAGSTIGTQYVAKADPDGYTLLMITDFHSINAALSAEKLLPAPLPYDSFKDFTPVSRLVNLQIMLMANPKLGVKTVNDIVARARSAPESVSAASPGQSSPHHVSFLQLESMAGIKFLQVPFQGSGPATTALMGQQVDLAFAAIGPGMQMAQDNKAVAIAVSGPSRDPRAPNVPTIAESGFPGFAVQSWMGIVAPAGTPATVVQRLNEELERVLKDPQVSEKLLNGGMVAASSTAEEFATLMRKDAEKMAVLFRTRARK